NWALKWVSTSTISMAIVFEPIGASILAYFILGEVVTASQWLGGTVVIVGLFLFTMSATRKKKGTLSYKKDDDGEMVLKNQAYSHDVCLFFVVYTFFDLASSSF